MQESKIQRTREDLYRDITTLAEIGIFNKEGVRKLANIIRFVQAFSDYPEKESKKPGENKIIKLPYKENKNKEENKEVKLEERERRFHRPSEKELRTLYRSMSVREIAEYFGISRGNLWHRLYKYGIIKNEKYRAVGDNNIGVYESEIKQYNFLTTEQKQKLAHRIKQGDIDALKELVTSNLRLVIHIAKQKRKKYKRKIPKIPLHDLIQEGSIGLIEAAKRFNPELGYKFSTYAVEYIRFFIEKGIKNNRSVIRVPIELQSEILPKWMKAIKILEKELGHSPREEEIAEYLNYKREKVGNIKKALKAQHHKSYLKLEDNLEDKNLAFEEPIDILSKDKLKEKIRYALNTLTYKEREVIKMRYGLNTEGKEYTLGETGRKYGISGERVRQIEAKAIRKLQSPSRTKLLEEFI